MKIKKEMTPERDGRREEVKAISRIESPEQRIMKERTWWRRFLGTTADPSFLPSLSTLRKREINTENLIQNRREQKTRKSADT